MARKLFNYRSVSSIEPFKLCSGGLSGGGRLLGEWGVVEGREGDYVSFWVWIVGEIQCHVMHVSIRGFGKHWATMSERKAIKGLWMARMRSKLFRSFLYDENSCFQLSSRQLSLRLCSRREMTQHCRCVEFHWSGWAAGPRVPHGQCTVQTVQARGHLLYSCHSPAEKSGQKKHGPYLPSSPPFSLAWLFSFSHPFRFILETLLCPGFPPRPHQASLRRTRPIQHDPQVCRACSQSPRLLLPQFPASRRCANFEDRRL